MVLPFLQQSESVIRDSLKNLISNDYLTGLDKYWSGDYSETAEYVSNLIANCPEHSNLFCLYRLWIEVLAERNDKQSLRALSLHLQKRGHCDTEHLATFQALQGVIHLELDELEAVTLIEKALQHELSNPYYWELKERLMLRKSNSEKFPYFKIESGAQFQDFFHWLALARESLITRNETTLETVLKSISSVFPASPTPSYFALHRHLEVGNFGEAVLEAKQLLKLYPDNSDYQILAAYSKLRLGEVKETLHILQQAIQVVGENDPDLLALLGYAYAELDKTEGSKRHAETAANYLRKALSASKAHGLPGSWIAAKLSTVTSEMPKNVDELCNVKQDELRPARIWLIKLSPRHQFELQTSHRKSIEHLSRPMGNLPRPGDLCFFAAEDSHRVLSSQDHAQDQTWRIIATYSVISEPIWHPYYRYTSTLKLETLSSIPVDVCLLDQNTQFKKGTVGKDHPYRFGVFELEEGALSIITELVKEHRELTTGEEYALSRSS